MSDELIINESNYRKFAFDTVVKDGGLRARGLIPRDFTAFPVGAYKAAKPFMMPLIPEGEWEDRLAFQQEQKAQVGNIRDVGNYGKQIPSLDQGNQGYCWAHSSTHAVMLIRAINNQPYIPLSAYAVACIIKNYANMGGWGSESLDFIAEKGIPDQKYWPQGSKDRSNDNPETWANARLHLCTEWQDHYPRNKAQLVTCLLLNIPVVSDFNWWGHSVCTMDLVSIRPFRTRILNSWSDQWGNDGTGILEGEQAIPDGACSPRVMYAAVQ